LTVLTFTTNTSWTVPNDWNPFNNTVECYGSGASGSAGQGGVGGNGGNYSLITNFSAVGPGNTVPIVVGYTNSLNTYFYNTSTILATGAASNGSVGSTIIKGGLGGTSNTSRFFSGGGGGGGAGPLGGAGGVGGDYIYVNSVTGSNSSGHGGGGGSGGDGAGGGGDG
jgi:hypothetical protein